MKDVNVAKVIGIIQARVGSTRLPGKVLMPLAGKSVLEHVVSRVRASKRVSEVIVATTMAEADRKVADLCDACGVRVFRGSEDDVLDRFYRASKLIDARHVVRITADCPVMDPSVIDLVVARHIQESADYTTNTLIPTYPDGEDVEIFTAKTLEGAWKDAKLSSEREHVTPYIRKHPEIFQLVNVTCGKDMSKKRWTLDELQDYNFISVLYEQLYPKNKLFGMEEVLDLLSKHPELEKINASIERNEGYRKSIGSDKVVKK